MSAFQRHPDPDELDTDDETDAVDPELRLRTVRTAASTIAESIRTEERIERRKTMRKKRSFFRRNTDKKRQVQVAKAEDSTVASEAATAPPVTGLRRNIYINMPLPQDEVDSHGEPVVRYVRNKVRTSSKSTLVDSHARSSSRPLSLCRIYRYNLHTQEPLRAIPPVSSTTQSYHAYPSHITYRVANLYFLALVIVQGERQRPFIDPPFCLVLVNPRMVTPSPKCSNVDSCLQQSALCTALPYSCCAGN